MTTNVEFAAQALREGRLVAFATETVYGLGANALDPLAVARVFEAKERPRFDPLIVHLADAEDLNRVASEVPIVAKQLVKRFWPGPLTLVLPKQDLVADLVTAGLPTVGIRVPDHPQARELIRLSGVPVAAPSANRFGRISPTTAAHGREQLGNEIDVILDGGPCRIGLESTVLQIRDVDPPLLFRTGGLPIEELEAEIGPVAHMDPADVAASQPQLAPGMLARHYAPSKPLRIIDDPTLVPIDAAVGLLTFQPIPDTERFARVEVLSPSGSLAEAAANFFAALRRLDASRVEAILAVRLPNHGLGRAMNDRLARAAWS